jgi:predicted PurR-regulated permease PerM
MQLRNFEGRVFFTIVIVISLIFLWMTKALLMPVFWAVVLAVLFWPLYRKLKIALKGREALAAFLTTLAVIFIVLIPLGLVATSMTKQALGLYQQISKGEIDVMAPVAMVESKLPLLMSILNDYGVDTVELRKAFEGRAVSITQWFAESAVSVGQNVAGVTVLFVLMLYLLFFFFRDGQMLVKALIRALPIGDAREKILLQKFAQVAKATVKGNLVVAAVQGAIGGFLFMIVGIQASVFWLPAAIFLLASGAIWQGVVLILGGSLIVGLIDNLLRPLLVGRETKMPDYVVLIATLGGLQVFGIAGFVLGPIITALCIVMWDMFAEEFSVYDSSESPVKPDNE